MTHSWLSLSLSHFLNLIEESFCSPQSDCKIVFLFVYMWIAMKHTYIGLKSSESMSHTYTGFGVCVCVCEAVCILKKNYQSAHVGRLGHRFLKHLARLAQLSYKMKRRRECRSLCSRLRRNIGTAIGHMSTENQHLSPLLIACSLCYSCDDHGSMSGGVFFFLGT